METLTHIGVNNWPFVYSRSGSRPLELGRDACRPALSSLATDIMNLRREPAKEAFPQRSYEHKQVVAKYGSPSTNLRVVTFGICEQIKKESNWGFGLSPPMDFVKARVSTVGGQQTWTMMTVTVGADSLDSDLLGQEYDIDELAHGIGEFESGVDEVQW
ncbi:MAG: hypothetical protein L6R42_005591 [Xanthoria sp. 1 TBL-2021]|nr:MAG: hypothetical protein L6R42_005591 [Xanthoria sp. 1 TBL-2021]